MEEVNRFFESERPEYVFLAAARVGGILANDTCRAEFINIGSGTDMKIRDMALALKRVTGFAGEIRHDATRPDGTPRKLMDNSRLRNLGWTPSTGFEEGAGKEFEWYRSQF